MINRYGVLLLLAMAVIPRASAQNVSGYDMMPDPFLFLLREPSVHRDLALSTAQQQSLVEINESFDAILLSNRNKKNADEVQQRTRDVFTKTRTAVNELLSKKQQDRLRQIAFRLKGISFVLLPDAATALALTPAQKETIQTAVDDANEKLKAVRSREYQGENAERESKRVAAAARKREQDEVMAALSDSQKRKLVALIGKKFDTNSLGHVSFKAPEIVDSGQWINSEALGLSDLRGKVVALHFFAFG